MSFFANQCIITAMQNSYIFEKRYTIAMEVTLNNKERVYNFSAGPSILPYDVLKDVAENLTNYNGSGQSVMEMSHRSAEFETILDDAERNFREVLSVPENYKVLFLQGGATLQFAMIPLNLLRKSKKADYILTGQWAKKAAEEAVKFGDIKIVASSEESKFTYIPKVKLADFRSDADYVHITTNNTIYGTRFPYTPDTGNIPLVGDMSSDILSEKIDVSKYGLIYAGAQKNMGPAGVTVVVVREDLLGFADSNLPTYLDYKTHASNKSLYNTPPTFPIYVAGEVLKKILKDGGISAIEKNNIEKAQKLYDCIDASNMFSCPVEKEDRSRMNVIFVTGNADLDKKFVSEAKGQGLYNLAGYRTLGGMRASIYNAMPMEGIDTLVEFMKQFEKANS